jgi:LmbE family N-acetylglucosaminyl deacetylase
VPLDRTLLDRKIEYLLQHFATQRSKDWFDAETFRGLARLRGMECRSPSGYAEAYFAPKIQLA